MPKKLENSSTSVKTVGCFFERLDQPFWGKCRRPKDEGQKEGQKRNHLRRRPKAAWLIHGVDSLGYTNKGHWSWSLNFPSTFSGNRSSLCCYLHEFPAWFAPSNYIYIDQLYFHPANPFLLSQKLVFAQQILCFTASLPHVDSAILVESWVLVWELNYPQQMTGIFRSWRHFQQKIQTSKRSLRWIDEMQSFPFGAMVFTSLPDMSEVVEFLGPRFEDWEQFFMKAVLLVRRQKERNQP